MDINYILRSILALILIIWLANVVLVNLSKYTQGKAKSIQIIERFSMNKNSSLAIVKILNQFYLMSISEQGNDILKEFTAEEVDEIKEIIENQQKVSATNFVSTIDFKVMKEKYADFFTKEKE